MFERFTKRARAVVVLAQQEAREVRASHIEPEHLLSSLLRDPESLAVRVVRELGASPDRMLEVLGRRRRGTAGLDESEIAAAALRVAPAAA